MALDLKKTNVGPKPQKFGGFGNAPRPVGVRERSMKIIGIYTYMYTYIYIYNIIHTNRY